MHAPANIGGLGALYYREGHSLEWAVLLYIMNRKLLGFLMDRGGLTGQFTAHKTGRIVCLVNMRDNRRPALGDLHSAISFIRTGVQVR